MDQDELDALIAASNAKAGQPAPAPAISAPAEDDDDLTRLVAAAHAKQPQSVAPLPADPGDSAPPLTVSPGTPSAALAGASAAPSGILSNDPNDTIGAGLAKNVATGAVKGVGDVGGFVGNTGNLADYLVARADSAITGSPVGKTMSDLAASRQAQPSDTWLHKLVTSIDPRNLFPSGPDVSKHVFDITGQYVPTTGAGKALQGGIEAAVGAAAPGVRGAPAPVANILGDVVRGAPAAATAGAAGTAVTNATGDPLIAALLMGAPAAAVRGSSAIGNRLMGTVDPATAQLAQTARDTHGIPLTAPQISDSPALRFGASAINRMPFSGAGAKSAEQQTAFNRAVAQTFGENAGGITPDVMQRAKQRIGGEFDRVAQNTTIRPDVQFIGDLRGAMSDAARVLPEAEVRPLSAQLENIADVVRQNGGVIPGESYQALTKTGSPLNRAMSSSDPNVSHYAGRIKDALDDTMRRSATPEDAQALTNAKLQYKNMKTVEDLVEKSPNGDISPPLLMGAVRKSYGDMAYRGGGDIGDLARIGQRFLKEPPSSGTAERTGALNTVAKLGGLGGAAMGAGSAYQAASPGEIMAGLFGIPASLGAGRVAGGVLRSNALADALVNRSLGASTPSRTQDLANALLFPYVPQIPSIATRKAVP